MDEIKLTKIQRKLLNYWQSEIMAMQGQLVNMVRMLGNEITSNLIDNFVEELNVDLDKFSFNRQSMSFKEKEKNQEDKKNDEKEV